jgi:phosphoserine phosphatase
MNRYEITYRESYVGAEGWIVGGEVETFRCHADSKVKALMRLVNLEGVHHVISVKRVKK